MCLSSLWTQPPYNERNSLIFWISLKPKQSQLWSHFDFGVNNQRSLPPSIPRLSWDPWARHQTPNWAATIWLPTAPGVCSQCVCVCVCVFTVWVHLDGLNAEHKFWVWVTILGHTSLHLIFSKFVYVWLCKSFYSRLFSDWGTIQGRFN